MEPFVAIGTVCALLIAGVPLALKWRRSRRRQKIRRAIRDFRTVREMLEAKFFDLAAQSGKPKGLRWLECDWQDAVTFGRDTKTGLLTAFVSVEIHFEAEEGSDMEEVAAVGTIRDACALFHWSGGRWGTGGRALFNMDAHDALDRLSGQYERLPLEAG